MGQLNAKEYAHRRMGWDGDLWLNTCLLSRDGGKGSRNQCKGTDYMVIYPAPHGPYHLSRIAMITLR